MGFVTKEGSLNNPDSIPTVEDAISTLQHKKEIYSISDNLSAINSDDNFDVINRLQQFISGTEITVIWYSQMRSDAEFSSAPASVSFLSDSVNTSFLEINNMKIKLQESLSFSNTNETTISEVTGSGISYPGFIPKRGDLFLYNLGRGTIGLFKISSNPTRLSIRRKTSYSFTFNMVKYITTDDVNALKERVRDTAYFNKKQFMLTEGTLLKHQSFLDDAYVTEKIDVLKKFYHKFYSHTLGSFCFNDNIYDPYLVKFYIDNIDTYSKNCYIENLYPKNVIVNWDRSIYAFMLNENVYQTPLNSMVVNNALESQWSSLISALQNRSYIELCEPSDTTETYITANIFAYLLDAYTDFDILISAYITADEIHFGKLKQLISMITSMSDEEQFYRIPILIYLLQEIDRSIMAGGETAIVTDYSNLQYINIPFTDADIESNILHLDSIYNKALAIFDDENNIIHLDNLMVEFVDNVLSIDLTTVMANKNITSIPGEWILVVDNNLKY